MVKQYEADYPGYYQKIESKAINFGLPIDLPSYPFPFIASNIYTQNCTPKWHKDNMDKKDFQKSQVGGRVDLSNLKYIIKKLQSNMKYMENRSI
jgi:hypothetical protein